MAHSTTKILHRLASQLRTWRGGWLAALLLLLVATALPACGGEPPTSTEPETVAVHTEPSRIVMHPDTGEVLIEIVADAPGHFVGDFKLEGPDWRSFSLLDAKSASGLEPGEPLTLRLAVDTASMLGPGEGRPAVAVGGEQPEPIAEDEFRSGEATLVFTARAATEGSPPVELRVPIVFEDPPWWKAHFLPALIKIHLLILGFVMPLASLLTWMERKQSAMMQDRLGPNRANLAIGGLNLRLWGLLHIVTDGLKMFFKEDFIPKRAHRALYTLAPLFGLIPAMVVFAIVPFGDAICYGSVFDVVSQADVDQCAAGRGGTPLQVAHIDVGLLYYFAIASIATYGTALAGWSSYNKWAILGALRASAQMISYEVAIGLSIVGALLVYGTLEPHGLVRAQMDSYWGLLLQPLAFVLFFTAAIAETKRAPFDLPEGESEIIGYFIEYSGMRFGLFFLGEFIEVVFVSALMATLFLGGWTLPLGMLGASGFSSMWACIGVLGAGGITMVLVGAGIWRASPHGESVGATVALVGCLLLFGAGYSAATGWGTEIPHILIIIIGMLVWGGKVVLLCWVQLLIRWTLPRFRYDQLMSLGWKGLLPLSIANIVLTAVVVYFLLPGAPPPPATPGG